MAFMDYINLLVLGFLFLMIIIRILKDNQKSHFKSFRVLSEKEKSNYDINKVKIFEILFIMLVYFFYVVGMITHASLKALRTIICVVLIVVLSLIFDRTKIIWNLFCKRK